MATDKGEVAMDTPIAFTEKMADVAAARAGVRWYEMKLEAAKAQLRAAEARCPPEELAKL
jgi:hypothetical protein